MKVYDSSLVDQIDDPTIDLPHPPKNAQGRSLDMTLLGDGFEPRACGPICTQFEAEHSFPGRMPNQDAKWIMLT